MKNKYIGLVIIGLIVLIGYLLIHFIEVPYFVHSRGIVMPISEWSLKKVGDGTLVSELKDNLANATTNFAVSEFQRGDLAEFNFNSQIFQGGTITKGDTIGLISSIEEEKKLIDLTAELEMQKSLLRVNLSGEKPENIRVATETMIKAEQEYETQKKLFHRNEILFSKEVIAEEVYDLSLNELKIKQQDFEIAKSTYEAMISGAKKEEIDYLQTTINSLVMQIKHTEKRLQSFHVLAPISGNIVDRRLAVNGYESILTIADNTKQIIVFPIEVYQLPLVKTGQTIQVRTSSYGTIVPGHIIGFDNVAQVVDQRQHVFVTALLDENNSGVLSGMMLELSISTGEVSLPEYIKRLLKIVYAN
jgi:HlyD family secretion protein